MHFLVMLLVGGLEAFSLPTYLEFGLSVKAIPIGKGEGADYAHRVTTYPS